MTSAVLPIWYVYGGKSSNEKFNLADHNTMYPKVVHYLKGHPLVMNSAEKLKLANVASFISLLP